MGGRKYKHEKLKRKFVYIYELCISGFVWLCVSVCVSVGVSAG